MYEMIEEKWYQLENGSNYLVDDEIITVKFGDVQQNEIDNLNDALGVQVVSISNLGYYDLRISTESDPIEMIQTYLEYEIVDIAELNTIGEYLGNPNDPHYSNQWHHFHQSNYDIDSPEAWNLVTGNPSVLVAIIDSGTDVFHEDLEGNIWVNPGEDLDGDGVVMDPDDINNFDDDGNGKIDDFVGWHFLNEDNNVVGPNFHGTHVAGVIGAVTNNSKGVAGVAGGWYPSGGVKMLTCNMGDAIVSTAWLDNAILYAVEMGADIINMSLNITTNTAIEAAIEAAHSSGVFIVVGAGNNGISGVLFSESANYVCAVGANNNAGNRAYFSNYGNNLDLVAPGTNIWSTQLNNTYGYGNGTSFSAPQISGVAALIKSQNGSYSNIDIESIISRSAEKIGGYSYNQTGMHGAWNNELGYGKLVLSMLLQHHRNHRILQILL